VSRSVRAEEHERSLQIPREGEVPNMRVFRGVAILPTVVLISPGVFILCDSMARRGAPASDAVIAGVVLFSPALALPHFLSGPAVI
jgi:hypothetical protein